jgi:hypothetical protein
VADGLAVELGRLLGIRVEEDGDAHGLGMPEEWPGDTPVGAGPGIRPTVVEWPEVPVLKPTWGTVTVYVE